MELELDGKAVLVTGSHRGTGLVIAAAFLSEGAHVFVHGFEQGQADSAVAEIGGGTAVFGDIRTEEGANAVADQVGAAPDILVNNYGAASGGRWESASDLDWLAMYETNVLSAQRMIRRFLPEMRERPSARIINLGTAGTLSPAARNPTTTPPKPPS